MIEIISLYLFVNIDAKYREKILSLSWDLNLRSSDLCSGALTLSHLDTEPNLPPVYFLTRDSQNEIHVFTILKRATQQVCIWLS